MKRTTKEEPSTYWTDGHLVLHYRGATVRLEPNDPRLRFIELLIFGETLPPPEPVPRPPPAPEPVAELEKPPEVVVPEAWVKLWQRLPETHRKLLVLLSHKTLTSPEIERELRVRKGSLRGLHILISLRAREVGFDLPVESIGSGREDRRYFVPEDQAPVVRELDRRWKKVREAMAGGAG